MLLRIYKFDTNQYSERHIPISTVNAIYQSVQWMPYTNQYSERHIPISTVNAIYQSVQWTPYTNQYSEHHIPISTVKAIYQSVQWMPYTNQYSERHTPISTVNAILYTAQMNFYPYIRSSLAKLGEIWYNRNVHSAVQCLWVREDRCRQAVLFYRDKWS
jgi:hypothetical protein